MRTAYFDCFSGVSGDMLLGALIDAGLDFNAWRAGLDGLDLPGYSVSRKKVRRAGLAGIKLSVKVSPGQPRRNLTRIEKLLRKSKLPARAKDNALKVFLRLAQAEAKAHGVAVEEVHFHEVGAVDSVVDIAGAALALEMMGVGKIISSPLNLGSGTVKFSHGTFPVPAPATAELIKGFPAYASDVKAELTTPTGAAVLTALADSFGLMPAMKVTGVGCGAGERDFENFPNLLRVFIGEAGGDYEQDTVSLIETNIDDMDPRIYGHVMETLFEAGALDVWLTPVIMKKSRPGTLLSVICDHDRADALSGIILKETTTFGVRVSAARRLKLGREIREIKTKCGPVRVKFGKAGEKVLKAVPEYEDVKALARKTGTAFRDIAAEADKIKGRSRSY